MLKEQEEQTADKEYTLEEFCYEPDENYYQIHCHGLKTFNEGNAYLKRELKSRSTRIWGNKCWEDRKKMKAEGKTKVWYY